MTKLSDPVDRLFLLKSSVDRQCAAHRHTASKREAKEVNAADGCNLFSQTMPRKISLNRSVMHFSLFLGICNDMQIYFGSKHQTDFVS